MGEGTWPSMRSTLKRIGISETDFIRDCDVSLKQGTLFSGWTDGKDIYTHPFTVPHAYSQHNLSRDWQNKFSDLPFAEAVCPQSKLMLKNQAPKKYRRQNIHLMLIMDITSMQANSPKIEVTLHS